MKESFLKKLWSVEKTLCYKNYCFLGMSFKKMRKSMRVARHQKAEVQQRYKPILRKLQKEVKTRKIKIAFLIQELQKWTCQSLYVELGKKEWAEISLVFYAETKEDAEMIRSGFSCQSIGELRIADYSTPSPLDGFDIVFYQQPWGLQENIDISHVSKHALTCYVPYCFYIVDSELNYFWSFHGLLWRNFVEADFFIDKYQKEFNADNCVSLGYPKFDCYRQQDKRLARWRFKDKKRIIYAPHHSFEDDFGHAMATWQWNGRLLLDLAKQYQDTTEWIFRPHPRFHKAILESKIVSEEELKSYYAEWESIGIIDMEGDYYDLFVSSDCMITDCMSFLAEYLPSGHPLLYLRSERQRDSFNKLGEQIISQYYQIHNQKELLEIFERVILNGEDWLKDKRIENIACLGVGKNETAGLKIAEYLTDILHDSA